MATQLRLHNGTPTPFIDDQPVFASYVWAPTPTPTEYPAAAQVAHYAAAGVHLHAFDAGIGREWCGPGPGHGGHFDFRMVEPSLQRVLEVDPEARFHLRINLEIHPGTTWWHDLYPQELEIDSEGRPTTQSFASRLWREQSKDFLAHLVGHLIDVGLADRIFAYQTGAGHTGEWCKGLTSMRRPCGDYSAPMREHFGAWLATHYSRDLQALRSAWQDPTATFEGAQVPSAEANWNTTHGSFRNPRREQPVIDYYACLAELCGDLIIDFNRTVKEIAGTRSLTGAFYGYVLEMAWNAGFFSEGPDSPYATIQRSGHLGLERVLRSPWVDVLVSPYSYGFRSVGGHGPAMLPTESVRAHGKIYLFEEDSRTHLAPELAGFGRVPTLGDSVAVLRRNMAEVVTRGHGIWWLVNPGHVDPVAEPAFRPLIRRFQQLGSFAMELDRTPAAQIAVLVDDESFRYESIDNSLDVPAITQQRLWGLPRLGAPADYYLLRDLLEDRLPPYRLYIFLNPWRLGSQRREQLAARLRRDNRVALWVYGAGYLQDGPDVAHIEDLTGFRVGLGEHPWPAHLHVTDFGHPITQSLPQDLQWGTDARLAPLFHLADAQARVLGEVVYSQGRCLPGLGVKELGSWRSVYSAVPNLPAPILRGVARYAGVHLYSEAGDVLYATPQLLAVHTSGGGARRFCLPRPAEVVYELYEGRLVAEDTDYFQVDLPPRSTSLWFTGERALLQRLPS